MTGVETISLDFCRDTGCSSVANGAIGLQHTQQQLSTCFGVAHCRHKNQQGGLILLSVLRAIDIGAWKKLRTRGVWPFVAKKPFVTGIITVCCTLAEAAATLPVTIHYKKNPRLEKCDI